MILELKRGCQALAFKVQGMNHSLGDLVTGLEGRSHVPGAGLSRGRGKDRKGEVWLPAPRLPYIPASFPGLSSPRSTAEICTPKYLYYVCIPDTPTRPLHSAPRPVMLSGKGQEVQFPFTSSSQPLLLGCQRRWKMKTKCTNKNSVSFLIKPVQRASPECFHS